MKDFKRIFGAGPLGMLISLLLLLAAIKLEKPLALPAIVSSPSALYYIVIAALGISGLSLIVWSFLSLKPQNRGKTLITQGALRHFRHPLYAAFLTFINFSVALYLNNYIFLIWALLLHPLWHLIIKTEENMLIVLFGAEYTDYCKHTGRFVPRFLRK